LSIVYTLIADIDILMSLFQENQTSCSLELSIDFEKLKDKKDSENTTSI